MESNAIDLWDNTDLVFMPVQIKFVLMRGGQLGTTKMERQATTPLRKPVSIDTARQVRPET